MVPDNVPVDPRQAPRSRTNALARTNLFTSLFECNPTGNTNTNSQLMKLPVCDLVAFSVFTVTLHFFPPSPRAW